MRAENVFIKVTAGTKMHQMCRFCILLEVDQHIPSSLVPSHKHTVGTTNNHGNTTRYEKTTQLKRKEQRQNYGSATKV